METRVAGLAAVEAATELLHRARLADAEGGLWEAADIQWWWRMPRRSDDVEQLFWMDADGPVAGALLTDWREAWGCDLIAVAGVAPGRSELLGRAVRRSDELGLDVVDMLVRDDDTELMSLATSAGFAATDDRSGEMWMAVEERPEVAPLAAGFILADRTAAEGAHPMSRRNGEHVEDRLRQCSLYDPALDLSIRTPDGELGGYGLFWHDPTTGVGLVEPMRVEDAYQRRGLGRGLLTAGLERLAGRGSRRLKVGYATAPARELYLGCNFRLTATATTWRRSAGAGQGRWRSAGPV
ncbi:MAG TPA: GNAT family N-acetyltransferase [Candidatus Limnocylindria bacterium]|nr:GNAT family N-acetyltransferase [Candidatus Limnocylindria bacterium]